MSDVDVRCGILQDAVARGGDIEQAVRRQSEIDKERVDRLLLASLNDDPEARQFEMDEIPACQDCYRALIMMIAGECSSLWEHFYNPEMDPGVDGHDRAIAMITERLAKNLDAR